MDMRKVFGLWKQALGRGIFPHQLSWLLNYPGRSLIMSANKLANRLPLKDTSTVLEIGPGAGYNGVETAKRIKNGRLELFDIQQEMLDKCKLKMEKNNIGNVGYTKGDASTIPFEEDTFDVVYLVTVFGEIEKKTPFLKNVKKVLKPSGILSITEHHPDPDLELFPTLNRILKENGFTLQQKFGWRWAYTANYKVV